MTTTYRSMDAVLFAVLDQIDRHGHWVAPRGFHTKELTALSFVLSNPRARAIGIPARRWSEFYAVGELCWHLSASDLLDQIAFYSSFWERMSEDGRTIRGSCYGKRIFGPRPRTSIWDETLRLLSEDPATRRATIDLSSQTSLTATQPDVPCISTIQFLIREKRLHCFVTMRSCDVIYGLCYDVYLVTMLQEIMSVQLGVELGEYHHASSSMHYYERHTRWVRRILREGATQTPPMPPMTDVEGIDQLLDFEQSVRDCPAKPNTELLESLSPYWLALARVLLHRPTRPASLD